MLAIQEFSCGKQGKHRRLRSMNPEKADLRDCLSELGTYVLKARYSIEVAQRAHRGR